MAVENGYQGVFMAPTEILAEQHYLSMRDVLREIGVRVEILSGSVKGTAKIKLLKEIEEGLVDVVVGTHALIEDGVKFKKLAFIVIRDICKDEKIVESFLEAFGYEGNISRL